MALPAQTYEDSMDLSNFNPNMRMYEGNHLGIARARVAPHVAALMPDAFILFDMLPSWENATIKNYATRDMHADFTQAKLYIQPGGRTREPIDNGCENFMFVLEGSIRLSFGSEENILTQEGYFWLPPHIPFAIANAGQEQALVLWIKKVYEPTDLFAMPKPLVSSLQAVPEVINPAAPAEVKQACLPDVDMGFDMAVNMLTYHPGVSFPRVEIHAFAHGAYFVSGRGGLWLNGVHYEIHQDDFCFMAPFAPHYAVAYGPAPMRYLLYKNANRDYTL